MTRPCLVCAAPFEVPADAYGKQFCSKACKRTMAERRRKINIDRRAWAVATGNVKGKHED